MSKGSQKWIDNQKRTLTLFSCWDAEEGSNETELAEVLDEYKESILNEVDLNDLFNFSPIISELDWQNSLKTLQIAAVERFKKQLNK